MIHREYEDLQWLEFELLANCHVVHGSFMRHGGYSQGHLASLNLGKSVGDIPENVTKNYQKILKALKVPNFVSAKACHGARVSSVSPHFSEMPISDGLSTQIKNLAISITQADCQAAIFFDPINHAFANVHCGWRGNVQNIYNETISHMKVIYGSKPENLLVCISPSLGPESSQFVNYKTELPEIFWQFQTRPYYFDLWAISEWQLLQANVLPHHIQIARIDTYANNQNFFSHRRSKECGRQVTICSLK